MAVKAGDILNQPKLRVTSTTSTGAKLELKDLTYFEAIEHLTHAQLDIARHKGASLRSVTLSLEEDHVPCDAVVHHGPGHQSRTRCVRKGPHEVHEADYGSYGEVAEWRGAECFTGINDEPPAFED